MELDKIKELIDMMKVNDLSELEIVDGETRIMLKRGGGHGVPQVVAMPSVVSAQGASVGSANGDMTTPMAAQKSEAQSVEEKSEETNQVEIVSPLVGTFYSAPSPNAGHFVEVGDQVEEDTVVCIIEAMKVMNEIKSEITGVIKKVLVSNGQAVEYGQPLFLVESK